MRWFGWMRRSAPGGAATTYASPVGMRGGRARARGIPYQFPRDTEEMNRLDFQHYLLRQALKGNYAAPIKTPTSILDVGTGTGRWAREMAQTFPTANVIGVDISPPSVDEAADDGSGPELRPENYTFVAANVLEGLPFADGSFDFTHMRFLVTAIPHDRWPTVVAELARVTRVGGWVECVEFSAAENGGAAMDTIVEWSTALFAYRGVRFADGADIGDWLRAANLANVTARKVTLPMGEYGGRIGKMVATDILNGANALRGLVVERGLATAQQVEQVLAQANADMASPHGKCLWPVYIAYGQRTR